MKAERLRRKWTQTALGARSKLSTSDISKIENGRMMPYPQQAARIAKALRLRPAELLEPVEADAIL